MKGGVLYGPRDVRFEERSVPKILEPTDAIVRTSATCVCGSDLWPYRGLNPINGPTPTVKSPAKSQTSGYTSSRL